MLVYCSVIATGWCSSHLEEWKVNILIVLFSSKSQTVLIFPGPQSTQSTTGLKIQWCHTSAQIAWGKKTIQMTITRMMMHISNKISWIKLKKMYSTMWSYLVLIGVSARSRTHGLLNPVAVATEKNANHTWLLTANIFKPWKTEKLI